MIFIKEETSDTLVISKSKFITYLKRCKDENEYKDFLNTIRKKHYDANHCCSAFISHNIQKTNDDKEPSRTAGVPILNAIINEKVNECAVIVVRYFGGIKLGASNLARTYNLAASQAIKKAKKIKEELIDTYSFQIKYEDYNKISNFFNKNNIEFDSVYDLNIEINFYSKNDIQTMIKDILKKDIEIKKIGQKIIKFDI